MSYGVSVDDLVKLVRYVRARRAAFACHDQQPLKKAALLLQLPCKLF